MEQPIKPQTQTLSQLAASYQVSTKTIRKWLRVAKIEKPENNYLFTPAQVKIIYEKFGEPSC